MKTVANVGYHPFIATTDVSKYDY